MAKEKDRNERVRRNTSPQQKKKIDAAAVDNIRHYKREGRNALTERITSLDREWDIERVLELNAAVLGFTGLILGAFVNRRWLLLPGVVSLFLVQHAVQGWCPPLPLFRKAGVRSRAEIDREKYALKALRKDFRDVNTANEAWKAVVR